MIEPQNTMLPVAEPRPVDAPQGEGEGFGAMLAQSLGLTSQVDPNAVQQINTNPKQQGRTQQNPAGEQAAAEEQPSPAPIHGVAGNALPAQAAAVPGAIPNQGGGVEEPPTSEDGSVGPVLGQVRPVGSRRFVRTEQGVAPLPTLPAPPGAEPEPHVVRPIDAIWNQADAGGAVVAPDVPAEGEMTLQPVVHGDTIWKPGITSDPATDSNPAAPGDRNVGAPTASPPAVPSQAPGINPPDPAVAPETPPTAVDEPVPSAPELSPTVAKEVRVEVDRGRAIPEPPALDSSEAGDSAPKNASGPMASPPAPTPPRVELAPERLVRLDSVPATRAVDRPQLGEPSTPVAEPVSADGGPALGTAQTGGATPSAASSTASVGLQPPASALAERVMQAIDMQRTQPPPRSMVVDIPELEGLRLVVSVRSAGHVTVTPASGTANPDVFAPFATDLSRVLAERGFVMNGDSRRQGYNPYNEEEAPPAPRRSTGFRRPAPVDNDLRI